MLVVKASPSEKSESHTCTCDAKIPSGQVYENTAAVVDALCADRAN